jgi:hypothetical protein
MMAWERRRRGGSYYYRSVRDGERVRKEYVGAGEAAEAIASADAAARRVEEEKRREEREELERLTDLAAPVLKTDEAAGELVRAALVDAGFRRHNGQWRMRRDA